MAAISFGSLVPRVAVGTVGASHSKNILLIGAFFFDGSLLVGKQTFPRRWQGLGVLKEDGAYPGRSDVYIGVVV